MDFWSVIYMRRTRDGFDPDYLTFVDLFNQGRYEESHRALTEAWQRNRTNDFYRGLIQVAGALEHWETNSLFWAEDMFATAHNLLAKYAPKYQGLNIEALLPTLQACNAAARQAREQAHAQHNVELPTVILELDRSPD